MNAQRARARATTAILLVVTAALLCLAVANHRKESRLREALVLFEQHSHEGIYHRLNVPLTELGLSATSLRWSDESSLEDVLAQIELFTRRMATPRRPRGIPIQVDPVGLREAGQSLASRVRVRPPGDEESIQEVLRHVLEPLGLAFHVTDGALAITSRQALERIHEGLDHRLDQSISLKAGNETPLDDVVDEIKLRTRGPGLPVGLPIYVVWSDLEKKRTRGTVWNVAPLPDAACSVREQLRRILEPRQLNFELRDGAIMITTQKTPDDGAKNRGRIE